MLLTMGACAPTTLTACAVAIGTPVELAHLTTHADNPGNVAKEGEIVTIRTCRPLSKTKHFEIVAAK